MNFHCILALLLLIVSTVAHGAEADTIAAPRSFPTARIVAPAAGAVTAYTLSRIYPHGSFVNLRPGERSSRGTDVLQYVPLALPWVMKAVGQPTASSWARMGVAEGSTILLNAAMTWALKHAIDSPRPDGTDSRSFPSGHTAWAFAGATVISKELGDNSAWYTWGAYTFASAIAMERVIDAHHYPTDVMAGASIGILATHAGYFLTDLIMDNRGIERRARPFERPDGLTPALFLDNMLSLPLGPVTLAPGLNIERRPALVTAIGYEQPVGGSVSLSAAAEMESMPLALSTPWSRFISGPMTALGVTASANMYFPFSQRFSLAASASAGWQARFNLHNEGDALSAGHSTALFRLKASGVYYLARHLSVAGSVGLQGSHYSFSLAPSEAYGITAPASAKGTVCSLLLSLSTRYEF